MLDECLLIADDTVLIGPAQRELQQLLNILSDYASDIDVKINSCEIVCKNVWYSCPKIMAEDYHQFFNSSVLVMFRVPRCPINPINPIFPKSVPYCPIKQQFVQYVPYFCLNVVDCHHWQLLDVLLHSFCSRKLIFQSRNPWSWHLMQLLVSATYQINCLNPFSQYSCSVYAMFAELSLFYWLDNTAASEVGACCHCKTVVKTPVPYVPYL